MIWTAALFALGAVSADPLAVRAAAAAALPRTPLHQSVAEKRTVAANNATTAAVSATAGAVGKRILIMGDSWGTLSPATEHFERELKQHNCPLDGFTNIAVGGSTANEWSSASKLKEAAEQAKSHDHVWITLMGNDARAEMPECAAQGHTAVECGDRLMASMQDKMGKIVDNLHTANPDIQIVGFGYDLMFGGTGCEAVQRSIFPVRACDCGGALPPPLPLTRCASLPTFLCHTCLCASQQCWKNETTKHAPILCFNTELVRLQEAWETLASTRPFIHPINILGATQIAGGDKSVTIGHPDITKNGPKKYWPITLICIHPEKESLVGPSGAMVIMAEFYKQYWSAALGC